MTSFPGLFMWNKLLNLHKVFPNEDVASSQNEAAVRKETIWWETVGKKQNSQRQLSVQLLSHRSLTHMLVYIYYVNVYIFIFTIISLLIAKIIYKHYLSKDWGQWVLKETYYDPFYIM